MRGLMNIENTLLSSMSVISFIKLPTDVIFRRSSQRFLCLRNDRSSTESEKENSILIDNLTVMGVDLKMVRKRQPGVLRRQITNEDGLKIFLQAKGVNEEAVASIISRYPRSIIRSYQSLKERWEIWQSILMSDLEIVQILKRSPSPFFVRGNNTNMQKNITLFCSIGLTSKDLGKMLTRVPRVFSNSTELNEQIIHLLNEIYIDRGGENADHFVKEIISRNPFILLRSSKQVKANIQFLQSSFNLDNEELLTLLYGQGGDILDLSNEYLKKTLANVKEKLLSHECTEPEVNAFVLKHPRILYLSSQNLNDKIDLLLQASISLQQVLRSPLVFDKNINTIRSRICELEKVNYNFGTHGIGILALSKQRFEAKMEKLCA